MTANRKRKQKQTNNNNWPTNISTGDGSQAATLGSWKDAHLDEPSTSADCNAYFTYYNHGLKFN